MTLPFTIVIKSLILNPLGGLLMFRMWGKIWKDTRLVEDTVIINPNYNLSRTTMVLNALEDICYQFNLSQPIWLDSNIEEFKKVDRTRFSKDNFIDSIEFDYLEIHVIEE